VRHQHAVEVAQSERAREVRDADLESTFNRVEGARVLIYGGDVRLRAEELGKGEGERAFARAEVGPTASPLPYAVLNQRYEIGVIQLPRAPSARPPWRKSATRPGRRRPGKCPSRSRLQARPAFRRRDCR